MKEHIAAAAKRAKEWGAKNKKAKKPKVAAEAAAPAEESPGIEGDEDDQEDEDDFDENDENDPPPPPILSADQANLCDQLEFRYQNKLPIPDTLMTCITETLMDWQLDERGFSTDRTHEALTSAFHFARSLRALTDQHYSPGYTVGDVIRSLLDDNEF